MRLGRLHHLIRRCWVLTTGVTLIALIPQFLQPIIVLLQESFEHHTAHFCCRCRHASVFNLWPSFFPGPEVVFHLPVFFGGAFRPEAGRNSIVKRTLMKVRSLEAAANTFELLSSSRLSFFLPRACSLPRASFLPRVPVSLVLRRGLMVSLSSPTLDVLRRIPSRVA